MKRHGSASPQLIRSVHSYNVTSASPIADERGSDSHGIDDMFAKEREDYSGPHFELFFQQFCMVLARDLSTVKFNKRAFSSLPLPLPLPLPIHRYMIFFFCYLRVTTQTGRKCIPIWIIPL